MTAAINVRNLGKQYQLGVRERGYTTFREALVRAAKSPFDRFRRLSGRADETESFWALRDVNFDIQEGEVVGIIGRNGAGKSTLLKVLSQITEPTTGEVELHGRVGSLLEVGTGFHPELSGRENIFLNGAILGMKRVEITRRFDEIVSFADIEKFLDTPVKRYSSGMYMRLAFAVAAHLEPDILVVDEVLSVGDAAFQEKCLGKMNSVAQFEGRTVLFVSHNISAVKQLCSEAIWLEGGKIRQAGPVNDVVDKYGLSVRFQARAGNLARGLVKSDGQIELGRYSVTNAAGDSTSPPKTKEDILIHVSLIVKSDICHPACGISIYNELGILMTCINTVEQGLVLPPFRKGETMICVRLNNTTFLPGTYTASFWVMNPQGHIHVMTEDSIVFEIAQTPIYGTCKVDSRWGCVYSDVRFSVERELHALES